MAGGGVALLEESAHETHFMQENILARIRREADEVELAHAGAAALDGGERALDELALQVEQALLGERRRLLLLGGPEPHVGARKGEEADDDHRRHDRRAFQDLRALT